jgi:decaprenylphospho-beta-D-ribofuranose 2-oxidase
VAASFGSKSLSLGLNRFNRILAFDSSGKEPTIIVEAGISLHKLHLFLCPQGLRVPVEPGHPQITIGGCIAFNVFGKNQFREGLFESCVEEIELFHPQKGLLTCSRNENKTIFELTIGGMGLTGVIVKAKLRLKHIPSPWLHVEKVSFKNLHHMVEVMKSKSITADSLHSFNDFTSFGKGLGQGFVYTSEFSEEKAPPELLYSFKSLERKPARNIKLFNRLTIPVFGLAYRTLNTKFTSRERMPFYKFNYPVASTPFYFDWYGKKGFVERQILVPDVQVNSYIDKFEALLRKYRPQIVLGSCKFFSGKQSLLHFAGTGLVISIDVMPDEENKAFHDALDEMNVEMKAIDNIAKDSRVTKDLIASEYPEYGKFRELLSAHDSSRQLASALSDKLCL